MPGTTSNSTNAPTQIVELLKTYENALNAGDLAAAISVYADDGVFMPQNSPTQVGREALKQAYEDIFGTIRLHVKFEIVEAVQLSDTWAFARTTSAGETTVLESGQKGPEANQELFLFQKQSDGAWKIARYIFSSTNPPK